MQAKNREQGSLLQGKAIIYVGASPARELLLTKPCW